MVIKLVPTSKCNLNCKTCYNAQYIGRDEISLPVIHSIYEDAEKLGCTRIDLLGGEPSCYSDFELLCRFIDKNNISTTITTNATNINDKNVEAYKCFSQVTVSVDGFSEETNDDIRGKGTFGKIKRSLEMLSEAECTVYLNCTINKKGLGFLDDSKDFFKYSCVKGINISYPYKIGNALNYINDFWPSPVEYFKKVQEFCSKNIELVREKNYNFYGSPLALWYIDDFFCINRFFPQHDYCMGGSMEYYIDANGAIYPCNLMFGKKGIKQISKKSNCAIGNVNTDRFEKAIESDVYNYFFQNVRHFNKTFVPYEKSICKKCPFFTSGLCSIKCPYEDKERDTCEICKYLINDKGEELFQKAEKFIKKYYE